ncbi:MAG: DUF2760 domain-containing protein [SAR324 cluster bacterium]|nr:DUF2760 domain-containing protein [SAR324 cluster bacterium]
MQKSLNMFYRIFIYSIACFWRIVFSRKFADRVYQVTLDLKAEKLAAIEQAKSEASEEISESEGEMPDAVDSTASSDGAEQVEVISPQKEQPAPEEEPTDGMYLLSLFQKSGRLIDFLQQDVKTFSNAEIGEAARVVHEGCAQVLNEYFTIDPIRAEEEGSRVQVEKEFDPAQIRLSGNVQKTPPFQGELIHHGWQVTKHQLPKLTASHQRNILAPAEIEI